MVYSTNALKSLKSLWYMYGIVLDIRNYFR